MAGCSELVLIPRLDQQYPGLRYVHTLSMYIIYFTSIPRPRKSAIRHSTLSGNNFWQLVSWKLPAIEPATS